MIVLFYAGSSTLETRCYSTLPRLHIFPGKLRSKWTGPYTVKFAYPHGAVILLNEKNGHEFKVNGQRVKHFYDQWQQEDTTEHVLDPHLGGV